MIDILREVQLILFEVALMRLIEAELQEWRLDPKAEALEDFRRAVITLAERVVR